MSTSQRRSSAASSHSRTSTRDSHRVADSRPTTPPNAEAAPNLTALGIHAAPPDIATPGLPLEVIDISSLTRAAGLSSAEAATGERRSGMDTEAQLEEVDITLGKSAWADGADEDVASMTFERERDSSPDGALGVDTTQRDVSHRETASRLSPDHPLRPDPSQHSPPPWEVVHPPESNNSHRPTPPPIVHEFGVKLPSRPLVPFSSYYRGPPSSDSAYGSDPIGQIGLHHPREIVRVERDYSGGELIQFAPVYPLELDGRVTPTQFLETINSINELLISAHSLRHSFVDSALAFFSLQMSKLFARSHYEKEMDKLHQLIDDLNVRLYNPAGLNILWPRKVAFLFLEIEYY